MEHAARPLRTPEKIAFALGDVVGGGNAALLNVLYFWFLSGVVGLQPGWAGLVFAVGKVWDALSKPVVGQLSDNTRTRWGRRRPWIVAGSLSMVLALALLYFPTAGWAPRARLGFALLGVVVYTSVAAIITTPYASLSTELTTDERERNQVNIWRLVCSGLSGAVVTLSATALSHAVQAERLPASRASLLIVLGFGGLFTAAGLLAGVVSRERTPVPAARGRFRLSAYSVCWRIPAWRSLLGLYLCAGLTMDVLTTQLIALTLYVIHVNATVFMAVLMVVSFAAFPLINAAVKRVSKNAIYGTLLPLAIVVAVILACYQPTWPAWPGYVLAVLLAIGIAGSQQMTWVMFPDVVDAAELQTGERIAGTLSGLMTLLRSLATAVLIQVVGLVLQAAGYRATTAGQVAAQTPAAVVALRVTVGGLVALLSLGGWLLARRYPLNRERVAAQHAELAQRRHAQAAA